MEDEFEDEEKEEIRMLYLEIQKLWKERVDWIESVKSNHKS